MAKEWWKGMSTSDVSREVYAAARMKYPAPEWVVLEEIEIPECRPYRRIDIVAISVQGAPRVVVLELKATRSDFMNEIRDPSKREPGMEFGTEFHYVLPQGMVDKVEMPEGCGLMEVQRGGKIKRALAGKQKSEVNWSQKTTHSMIGKLMRREDPDHKSLLEAGTEAAKTFRQIFKLAGKNLDFEDLMVVVRAMNRGHRFRIEETILATKSYTERKDADPEVLALYALRDAVREKCGYRALSANGFREWFGASDEGKIRVGSMADLKRALLRAKIAAENALKELG